MQVRDPFVLRIQFFLQDRAKAQDILNKLLADANGDLCQTDNPDVLTGMQGMAIALQHKPADDTQRGQALHGMRALAQRLIRTGYMFAMVAHDLISNGLNMINVLLSRSNVFDTPTIAKMLSDNRSVGMQMLALPTHPPHQCADGGNQRAA